MHRITRPLAFKALVLLFALIGLASLGLGLQTVLKTTVNAAQPQSPFGASEHFIFTNASLKGTYAGVIDCSLLAGPVTGRCVISYLYTADGNGNITDTDATINLNGATFTGVNFPGTYTVQTNGRVILNATPINGPFTGAPLSFSNVVTETNAGLITELHGVGISPPGSMATNVEKRIRK